jgi:hypothetical protein
MGKSSLRLQSGAAHALQSCSQHLPQPHEPQPHRRTSHEPQPMPGGAPQGSQPSERVEPPRPPESKSKPVVELVQPLAVDRVPKPPFGLCGLQAVSPALASHKAEPRSRNSERDLLLFAKETLLDRPWWYIRLFFKLFATANLIYILYCCAFGQPRKLLDILNLPGDIYQGVHCGFFDPQPDDWTKCYPKGTEYDNATE